MICRDDEGDDDAEEGEILEDGELPESDGDGGGESAPDDQDTQRVNEEDPDSDGKGTVGPHFKGQGSKRDQEAEEEDAEEMAEYHHRSSSHRKKRKRKHRRERAKRRRHHRSGSGDEVRISF